ncbi:MAG TPA: hypothetical protein VIF09_15180, partial [Polyangiaceae bacterium]
MLTLTLSVADETALRTLYEKQLAQGLAFVPGAGGVEAALAACELVVEHAGRRHVLAAEVVFVKEEEPGKGVGVQLAPMDAAAKEALRVFVESCPAAADEPADDDEPMAVNMHERLRALPVQEQQRLAASGTLSERVMLERMYGPTVWETLLRNARLTIPEVARIGRKGTLPRPLVELIAANASWLAAGEVQRALLANQRSSPAVVERVLRTLSRADLMLVQQQTAYPAVVRQAAK